MKRGMLLLLAVVLVAVAVLALRPKSTAQATGVVTPRLGEALKAGVVYCGRDQYNNEYTFALDTSDPRGRHLTGAVKSAQACSVQFWPLQGSFYNLVGNSAELELSAFNPEAASDSQCLNGYKIMGTAPQSLAWYLDDGYAGQEFNFRPCLGQPADLPVITSGGMRR